MQFYWFLSDYGILVKIPHTALQYSIDSNIHAYMECTDLQNLQNVECGSIPQQRYRLSGQKVIQRISLSVVPTPENRIKVTSSESPETPGSTPNSPSIPESTSFEVLAIGSQSPLCTYQISRDTHELSVGALAVNMAKSIYGAVRNLAGYGIRRK